MLTVVTNIGVSIFLPDLKAAFTKLANIHIHKFFFGQFWVLFTKIKIHQSNLCIIFSGILLVADENLIKVKKYIANCATPTIIEGFHK